MAYTMQIKDLTHRFEQVAAMAEGAAVSVRDRDANFIETLDTLSAIAWAVEQAQRTAVELARETGATWADVARASGGISRQGAQQRWG